MKIRDLSLTLFAWTGIPPTTYGRHSGRFEGKSTLGLLRLVTDAGLEGHAFLGSAMRPATLDAESLIQVLKPLVIGQDPLDRERLVSLLWQAFHMSYEVHHGGNSLNNVANLQVTMAIRNTEMFEVLLPSAAQKYGLSQDVEVDTQGLVHAPAGPGLGAQIDFDLIERTKTAVLA